MKEKQFVSYRLRKFLDKWEFPDQMDLSYDLRESSDPDEQYCLVDKIIQEQFLSEFWDEYGNEIGEYDHWKDYINDFFTKKVKEHHFPTIGLHYFNYDELIQQYLEKEQEGE